MTAPLLQLTNVTKSFGAVRALKGVSFNLHPGEVHALVGENGAGKSTLIKIITGAHQPDSGVIEIDGVKVERLNPASARALGIAAIYQQPALFPDLSVAENLALGLEKPSAAHRIHWAERRSRAAELLDGESVGTREVSAGKVPVPGSQALTESELIRMMVGRELSVIFPPAENTAGEPLLALQGVGCRPTRIQVVSLHDQTSEIVA